MTKKKNKRGETSDISVCKATDDNFNQTKRKRKKNAKFHFVILFFLSVPIDSYYFYWIRWIAALTYVIPTLSSLSLKINSFSSERNACYAHTHSTPSNNNWLRKYIYRHLLGLVCTFAVVCTNLTIAAVYLDWLFFLVLRRSYPASYPTKSREMKTTKKLTHVFDIKEFFSQHSV